MFIVNQSNNICVEVQSILINISYPDAVLYEASTKKLSIMSNSYNYGSTSNAELAADKVVKDYLQYKSKIYNIYVNDSIFATYDTEEKGKYVFNKITEGLRNKETLLDLSSLDIPAEILL